MKEQPCSLEKAHTRVEQTRDSLIAAGDATNPSKARMFFGKILDPHYYKSNLDYRLWLSAIDFEETAFNLEILSREQEILKEAEGLVLMKTAEHARTIGLSGLRTRVVIEGQVRNRALSLSLEKVEGAGEMGHQWNLNGTIDGRKLSNSDAAVLWTKYYTVLRKEELRKAKQEDEEANARMQQEQEDSRRKASEAYDQEVKPLFRELTDN